MKPHLLLILFASTVLAVNQNSQQQREMPLDVFCGRGEDKKCISGGILNSRITSVELLAYPQKATEKQIEGTVTIEVLVNEDGEVIFASPLYGPEELWAASVKAAVTARFAPVKLSGKPIKVKGVIQADFKNGKMDIPHPKPGAPIRGVPTTIRPRI
jgi:TonB family protein